MSNSPNVNIFKSVVRQIERNGHRFLYPNDGPLYGEPIYPGNGYPPNPGENRPGLSPWGRLAKGQTLGKSSILLYNGVEGGVQSAPVDMMTVEGDDLDAQQLIITLAPPRVIPIAVADLPIDLQNVSGEQTNAQVVGEFPGTAAPLKWPPLEAVIEWGVRGASARAVVDYVNGMTVSVVASYLRVHAAITQSAESGDISGTSAAYYLNAFVGPGYVNTGTARRTVYVGFVDTDAESDVFDVPMFAKRAYVFGCDVAQPPAVTTGYLRFWQSSDGNAGGNNVGNFFANGNQPVAFDVPAAGQYFSVYNQSGTNMKMGVIFELSL